MGVPLVTAATVTVQLCEICDCGDLGTAVGRLSGLAFFSHSQRTLEMEIVKRRTVSWAMDGGQDAFGAVPVALLQLFRLRLFRAVLGAALGWSLCDGCSREWPYTGSPLRGRKAWFSSAPFLVPWGLCFTRGAGCCGCAGVPVSSTCDGRMTNFASPDGVY